MQINDWSIVRTFSEKKVWPESCSAKDHESITECLMSKKSLSRPFYSEHNHLCVKIHVSFPTSVKQGTSTSEQRFLNANAASCVNWKKNTLTFIVPSPNASVVNVVLCYKSRRWQTALVSPSWFFKISEGSILVGKIESY